MPLMELMETTEKSRTRRNVIAAFITAAAILASALLPAYCRDQVEPQARYENAGEARRSADAAEWVPSFLPSRATDVYERHGRYRRFVRFTVDSAGLAELLPAVVRLDTAQARRVPVPVAGWTAWWQLTPRTLETGQGKQVQVYRVDRPARDRGYLVLDPRTLTAYYWSTQE